MVNVVGTVNVFEAVKRRGAGMAPIVYTSSIGMYSADDADPATGRLTADARPHPLNHYGVFKQANEGNARVYWLEDGIRERRAAPDDGLRRRARPGDDERPDEGDRGRRARPPVHRGASAARRCSSTRRTRPGCWSPRAGARAPRRTCTTCRARWPTGATSCDAIEAAVPGVARADRLRAGEPPVPDGDRQRRDRDDRPGRAHRVRGRRAARASPSTRTWPPPAGSTEPRTGWRSASRT